MSTTTKKCAHEMCTCLAEPGSKYCCLSCQDSMGKTTLACDCKHAECENEKL